MDIGERERDHEMPLKKSYTVIWAGGAVPNP